MAILRAFRNLWSCDVSLILPVDSNRRFGGGAASGSTSASSDSYSPFSSRLLNPIVASRTRKTSYPARLISPMAAAMRSESDSDSLIAFPSSCISSLSFSSTHCPFLRSAGSPSGYHSIFLMLPTQPQFHQKVGGPRSGFRSPIHLSVQTPILSSNSRTGTAPGHSTRLLKRRFATLVLVHVCYGKEVFAPRDPRSHSPYTHPLESGDRLRFLRFGRCFWVSGHPRQGARRLADCRGPLC